MANHGQIAIGTITFDPTRNWKWVIPERDGFKYIQVMGSDKGFDRASPYTITVPTEFKDGTKDVLHENGWQFGKVYLTIPAVNKAGKWVRGAETHAVEITDDNPVPDNTAFEIEHNGKKYAILDTWVKWNYDGCRNGNALRWPVGKVHARNCLFAVKYNHRTGEVQGPFDYVESRKQYYVPKFIENVKRSPEFQQLLNMSRNGENLLICEVDGPRPEFKDYYEEKGIPKGTMAGHTMLFNKEYLQILLNDTKKPFGHGFCLAIALMEELEGRQIYNPETGVIG